MITPQQVQNIYQSWKSTVTGICGFVIVIIIAYTTLPPKAGHTVTALAVLRAVVDFIKKDAGSVVAIPAGGGAPVMMDSTEVPLESGATVVAKEQVCTNESISQPASLQQSASVSGLDTSPSAVSGTNWADLLRIKS